MKVLFLLLLSARIAFGAIAAETVWEINGAGSMNSSAGFNPANANMPTDLTTDTNTGNTDSPIVSSASYNFVAGDVGHFLYVKSGTNWIPGWYAIASVASNKATLTATIGAAQLTDYTDNTAAGVASVGTPTAGTWAIDYSRSAAARFTATDMACPDGDAVSPTVTSAATPFGVSHVANLIKVTAGAGYTVANYEIVSVSGTTATLDKAVGTDGAKTSGTFYVGGAASMLSDASGAYPSSNIVGSNVVWVKGTITTSATTQSFAGTATAAAPSRLEGYKTKRGDGYLGRSGSGALVTTNFATFTFTGSQRFSATTTWGIVKNLRMTGACDNSVLGANSGTHNVIANCSVENSSTGTSAAGVHGGNTGISILNCDATLTGGSNGHSALRIDSGARVIGCRADGGAAAGITTSGAAVVINNVIYDCGTHGIAVITTTSTCTIFGNTIARSGGNGIDVLASSTATISIINNMITDSGGFGVDINTSTAPVQIFANRLRDNVSGNIGVPGVYSGLMAYDNITTDGAALSDYTNAAGGDYTPVAGSPAVNAGLMDITIGALQRDQTGSGGGGETSSTFVQ